MKRSEMKELIKTVIDAGRDWADLDTRAENLLGHIEQAGMLPPPVCGQVKAEENEAGEIVVPVWHWEPEDGASN